MMMMSIQDKSYSIGHEIESILQNSLHQRVTPELKLMMASQIDDVFYRAFEEGYLKHRVTAKAKTTIWGDGDPSVCIPVNDSITLHMYNEDGDEISTIPFIDAEWCFPLEVAKRRALEEVVPCLK